MNEYTELSWKNYEWIIAAKDLSENDFTKKWAALVDKAFASKIKEVDIMALYNKDKDAHNTDNRVREMWKYGASNGVSGTPTIFINGVKLDAEPAPVEEYDALFKSIMFPKKMEDGKEKPNCLY